MALKSKLGTIFLIALSTLAAAMYWQTATYSQAPAAVFKTIKGETISLADLKGKPVLVTFWATDCPGCIEEIPHLIKLHKQYAEMGLSIIAVAMHYDPPNHVLAMAAEKQLPYKIALDPSGEHAKAFGNVQLTPTSFLIDKNGTIVMQKIGTLNFRELEEQLKRI